MTGREIDLYVKEGKPFRALVNSLNDLKNLIVEHQESRHPVYLSVQPYEAEDKPSHIERVFFEFDDERDPGRAVKEAFKFAAVLKRFYRAEPLLVVSGRRGAYLYVFKETYHRLQQKLLKGLNPQTLDLHVVGDIKRLTRVPYTVHGDGPPLLDHKPQK